MFETIFLNLLSSVLLSCVFRCMSCVCVLVVRVACLCVCMFVCVFVLWSWLFRGGSPSFAGRCAHYRGAWALCRCGAGKQCACIMPMHYVSAIALLCIDSTDFGVRNTCKTNRDLNPTCAGQSFSIRLSLPSCFNSPPDPSSALGCGISLLIGIGPIAMQHVNADVDVVLFLLWCLLCC